jgi:hypothetical protein
LTGAPENTEKNEIKRASGGNVRQRPRGNTPSASHQDFIELIYLGGGIFDVLTHEGSLNVQ